jgi:hypothetical protein
MRARLLVLAVVLAAGVPPALALHPDLSPDESSRLQAALDAQGCAGGNVVISPQQFAINGARCGRRPYDLVFDRDYKLLRKEPKS